MNICVFGAGAVGSHVAARLAASGVPVSVVARGKQLEAISRNGLRLNDGERAFEGRPLAATDDPSTLPAQDIVIVALKAPSLPTVAESLSRLLAPDGTAVFVLNGIPWWWREGLAGPSGPLELLDPGGNLWSRLRQRTIGCITYAGSEVVAPGVTECRSPGAWIVGEPDGTDTPRLMAIHALLQGAGLEARRTSDLRHDIWLKLLVTASRNCIAALTRLPSLHLSSDEGLHQLLMAVMGETLATARASGWLLDAQIDLATLAAPGNRSPSQRPSMLQDILAGRSIEHEAVLGQLTAFAREGGVPTPTCDVLLALLRGLDQSVRLPEQSPA